MPSSHICLCTVGSAYGGMERFICDYANWLVRKNIKVTILLPNVELLQGHLDERVLLVQGFDWVEKPICLASLNRSRRLFKNIGATHVVFNNKGLMTFASSVVGAKLAGVRCVALLYHANVSLAPSFGKMQFYPCNLWWVPSFLRFRFVNLFSSVSVFNNKSNLAKTKKLLGLSCSRLELLTLGVNTERFRPNIDTRKRIRGALDFDDNVFVIGTVCRLDGKKGEKDILYGLLAILKHDPNIKIRCIFVGDGEAKNDLVALVNSLGLSCFVIFIGHVDNPEDYFNALDVFITLSLNESFGLSLLEAMACGKACIATKSDGLASLLAKEDGFISVNAQDVDGFAAILKKLYFDRALLNNNGILARNSTLSRFCLDRTFNELNSFLGGCH